MDFNVSWIFVIVLLAISILAIGKFSSYPIFEHHQYHLVAIPIENAVEKMIIVDPVHNIRVWYRTWGNRSGIPLLFVHGGPGNAVEDYGNGNSRFFDYTKYYVLEVDQRGTGKSQPSVRDSWHNMKYYTNISIDTICMDFELIRIEEMIDKWVVWGGSFGSTISINYGTRFPERCLGLLLRGIYLDSEPEIRAVYSEQAHEDNPKRLREYMIFYEYVANYSESQYSQTLDPNDSEKLLRLYNEMITSGDRYAIWHWHVFENNLMEEDPINILDPFLIRKENFHEARSVAFFETTLWLHGTYSSDATNLLDRIGKLKEILPSSLNVNYKNKKHTSIAAPINVTTIWICQGLHDEVCPPQYAKEFATQLVQYNVSYNARFVDGGHEDTDPVMEQCLKEISNEFFQQQ